MANILADRSTHAPRPTRRPVVRPERTATDRPDPVLLARLDHVRVVLEDARAVIERGWLQHGWYTTRPPRPRSLAARLWRADPAPAVDEIHQACLVAALSVAAHGGGRPDVIRDAGPTLDLVWDTMREQGGRSAAGSVLRAVPPAVRTTRIRELVRWNDAAGRTRQDVLALLDRAISATILAAVEPAGRRG